MTNTFGIRKVTRPAGECDEYGIRQAGNSFIAVICGSVRIFGTLGGAVRYMKKNGFDAFGNHA